MDNNFLVPVSNKLLGRASDGTSTRYDTGSLPWWVPVLWTQPRDRAENTSTKQCTQIQDTGNMTSLSTGIYPRAKSRILVPGCKLPHLRLVPSQTLATSTITVLVSASSCETNTKTVLLAGGAVFCLIPVPSHGVGTGSHGRQGSQGTGSREAVALTGLPGATHCCGTSYIHWVVPNFVIPESSWYQ